MTVDYTRETPLAAGTVPVVDALQRFQSVLQDVSHPEFTYQVVQEDHHYFLRVQGHSTDNMAPRTSNKMYWYGRKWRLSKYMTDGEIVQTALVATLAAAEHEHRERFTYKNVSVFDPHYDIEKLVAMRSQPDALKERSHGPA